MAKRKPAGWRGELNRHAKAARLGWRRRRMPEVSREIVVDLTGDGIETAMTERLGEMVAVSKKLEPPSEEEPVRNAEKLVAAVINAPEIKIILDRAERRLARDDYWFLMEELSFSLLDVALEMDVAVDGMVSPSDFEAGVRKAKPIIESIKKANDWEF